MSTHTPGPWTAEESGNRQADGQVPWAVYAPDDSEYASPGELQCVATYLTQANARLIAAAPALLAACEAVKCHVCGGKGTLHRSCSLCGDSTYDHVCDDYDRPCTHCDGKGRPQVVSAAIALARGQEVNP